MFFRTTPARTGPSTDACYEVGDDELRTGAKAVTRAGQVKDRERHEKDDRRHIGDRREYVLGWSNDQKIEAMIAHAAALQRHQTKLAEEVGAGKKTAGAVAERLEATKGIVG